MMKKVLILLGVVCLAGCMPHFKSFDSYGTLSRHGEAEPTGKGDPYTFGGIGEGSGGLMPRQTYADDSGISDFRDATETGKLGQIDKGRVETPDVREGGPVGTRETLSVDPRSSFGSGSTTTVPDERNVAGFQ